MHKSLLLLASIFAVIHNVQACSCAPATLQEHFFNADLTVIGRVLAIVDNCPGGSCHPIEDQVYGRIRYIISAGQTVKGAEPEDGILVASTALNDGLCRISLKLGKVYLLNLQGPITRPPPYIGTEMPVNSCNGVYEWESVTGADREFIEQQ